MNRSRLALVLSFATMLLATPATTLATDESTTDSITICDAYTFHEGATSATITTPDGLAVAISIEEDGFVDLAYALGDYGGPVLGLYVIAYDDGEAEKLEVTTDDCITYENSEEELSDLSYCELVPSDTTAAEVEVTGETNGFWAIFYRQDDYGYEGMIYLEPGMYHLAYPDGSFEDVEVASCDWPYDEEPEVIVEPVGDEEVSIEPEPIADGPEPAADESESVGLLPICYRAVYDSRFDSFHGITVCE